jgi:hypothetical protein
MDITDFDHDRLLAQARARLQSTPHSCVAIEAYWDGDTSGWFLVVVALVDHPGWHIPHWRDQPLPTWLHPRFEEIDLFLLQGRGGDLRVFNGLQSPWPEAVVATAVGTHIAHEWQVPFYFPAPLTPDDSCPRWWQQNDENP